LRTGNGEIFKKPNNLYELIGYTSGKLSETEERLLTNFLKMDPQERKVLIEYAEKLFDKQD